MLFALKLLIAGWVVLLFAVAANAMAASVKLMSWYDMFKKLRRSGMKTFAEAGILNLLWLFLFYPLLLGFAAWLGIHVSVNWG